MDDHGKSNARSWLGTIVEGVAAYEALNGGDVAAEFDGETFDDADALRERLQEGPLSVEVRGGWYAYGAFSADQGEPAEARILLTTGGPGLQIECDVDGGEAYNPRLQYQDWGTPWTDYPLDDSERAALATYTALFIY